MIKLIDRLLIYNNYKILRKGELKMTDRNRRDEAPEAESVEFKIPKRNKFIVMKDKLLGGITGLLGKLKKSKKKEKSSEEDEDMPRDRRPDRPLDGRPDKPLDGRTEIQIDGRTERPLDARAERPLNGRPGRPTEEDEGKPPEKNKFKLDKLHIVVIVLAIVAVTVIILAGVMYKKASALNSEVKNKPVVTEAPKVTGKAIIPGSVKVYTPPNGFDMVKTSGIKFAKPITWVVDANARATGNNGLLETVWAEDVKNTHLNVFAFKHNLTKTERIKQLKVSQLNEFCIENGSTNYKVIEFEEITVGNREALETLFYYTLGENRYLAYQITVPTNKKDYVFTMAYRNGSTTMDVELIVKMIVDSLQIN